MLGCQRLLSFGLYQNLEQPGETAEKHHLQDKEASSVSYLALPFIDLPLKPRLDFCRMFAFLKGLNMFTIRLLLSYLLFKDVLALSGK